VYVFHSHSRIHIGNGFNLYIKPNDRPALPTSLPTSPSLLLSIQPCAPLTLFAWVLVCLCVCVGTSGVNKLGISCNLLIYKINKVRMQGVSTHINLLEYNILAIMVRTFSQILFVIKVSRVAK